MKENIPLDHFPVWHDSKLLHANDPDDIGQAVVYLCSPASKFVTGTLFPVDGGAQIGF